MISNNDLAIIALAVVRGRDESPLPEDSRRLDVLPAEHSHVVGPPGSVLDRTRRPARSEDDSSVTDRRSSDVEVREQDIVMLVGLQTQAATHRGHSSSFGRSRLPTTRHRRGAQWRVPGVQLSGPLPDGAPA